MGNKREGMTLERAEKEAAMKQPTSPDIPPKDHDWHMLIVKRSYNAYAATIGHYTGTMWVLGDTRKPVPANVVLYDAVPRMENLVDGPVIDHAGMMELCEIVLAQWRHAYEEQARACRDHPSKEQEAILKKIEREFPTWIVGRDVEQAAIDHIWARLGGRPKI